MSLRRCSLFRRPSPVAGAVASLAIHLVVTGAVLALEAWFLLGVTPPEFGGKRTVVQLELAPSSFQPAAPETVILPLDEVAPLPESFREPPSEVAQELLPPRERLPPERHAVELPVVTQTPPEPAPFDEPRELHVAAPPRRSSPIPQPTTPPEPQPHPPQRRAEASFASLPQVAIPQLAGTDDETPPDLTGNRKPEYPVAAYRKGLEGEVLLRLWINATGRVERVEVERSSGHAILDRAAVDAVRTWQGRPAVRGGQPVDTVELLPIRFVLSRRG